MELNESFTSFFPTILSLCIDLKIFAAERQQDHFYWSLFLSFLFSVKCHSYLNISLIVKRVTFNFKLTFYSYHKPYLSANAQSLRGNTVFKGCGGNTLVVHSCDDVVMCPALTAACLEMSDCRYSSEVMNSKSLISLWGSNLGTIGGWEHRQDSPPTVAVMVMKMCVSGVCMCVCVCEVFRGDGFIKLH